MAFIYLFVAATFGYYINKLIIPEIFNISGSASLSGKPIDLSSKMVVLPAAFLTGTLIMTWSTYLSAYAFKSTGNPLLYGNIIALPLFSCVCAFFIYKNRSGFSELSLKMLKIEIFFKNNRLEFIYVFIVAIFWSVFMFRSFNITGNLINIGTSVFSDFGPHLAIIRSFSAGSNFPTAYPHFADGTIRYHFLFQFLAGNLEFLGLRLDWAFNLPSILSIVAFYMLLYSFSAVLFGYKWVGIITSFLFTFRSSFAFFYYVKNMKSIKEAISSILANSDHIGNTLHEDWGLWSQKVYVNQRHLSFGMGIMLLILIVMFPVFKKMISALKNIPIKYKGYLSMAFNPIETNKKLNESEKILEKRRITRKVWMKEFLFASNAWFPNKLKRAFFIGILLGLLGFVNGAVVIATLPILFVMSLLSKHRLEYAIIAAITVLLAKLEAIFFMGLESSAIKTKLFLGFLTQYPEDVSHKLSIVLEQHDYIMLLGLIPKLYIYISAYFIQLYGILIPLAILAGILYVPKGIRWLTLAFLTPLFVAITMQLTPDIAVNHKYIIISAMLLSIVLANFLFKMFINKKVLIKIVAVFLVLLLSITGYVDIITLYNQDKHQAVIKIDDPILIWASDNTKPTDIFLSYPYCNHPILLAGRKLFYGWPYFAWSAGYDTEKRKMIASTIFSSNKAEDIKQLANENNIKYVIIDNDLRNSNDYKLNEAVFRNNLKLEFSYLDTQIYRLN